MYKIGNWWEPAVWHRELSLVLCDDLDGWHGGGWEECPGERGYMYTKNIQRICLQCRRPQFDSWVRKTHGGRDRLSTPVFLGFPWGSADKESACNVGDLGLIPGLGRSPGEGKGYPLQLSGLENSMDL